MVPALKPFSAASIHILINLDLIVIAQPLSSATPTLKWLYSSPLCWNHRYLHIMKGEKSPRLSGQVLPGYSLLITSRYL
ncbi:hypothetical protein EXD76_03210, partial [BEV proteobacterium]|nr:hypothetical protein [Candidatus Symbiopectobacterium sp. Chty_BC]